jgi:hypothetical protein
VVAALVLQAAALALLPPLLRLPLTVLQPPMSCVGGVEALLAWLLLQLLLPVLLGLWLQQLLLLLPLPWAAAEPTPPECVAPAAAAQAAAAARARAAAAAGTSHMIASPSYS